MNDEGSFATYDPSIPSPQLEKATATVRGATLDDIAELARLAVSENLRSPADGSGSTSVDHWTALFTNNLGREDRYVTVAEAEGRLVGYGRTGWFAPDDDAPSNAAPAGWYLLGLTVDPARRRRGIARALTDARLTWVAARADEAWYFANASNHVSLALHASLGFVEVTRDFWFPGVEFDGGTGLLCRIDLTDRAAAP